MIGVFGRAQSAQTPQVSHSIGSRYRGGFHFAYTPARSPAHEELDHFVDEQQGEGETDAGQPLVGGDLGQAQEA
jgi:hypothetical protein